MVVLLLIIIIIPHDIKVFPYLPSLIFAAARPGHRPLRQLREAPLTLMRNTPWFRSENPVQMMGQIPFICVSLHEGNHKTWGYDYPNIMMGISWE